MTKKQDTVKLAREMSQYIQGEMFTCVSVDCPNFNGLEGFVCRYCPLNSCTDKGFFEPSKHRITFHETL